MSVGRFGVVLALAGLGLGLLGSLSGCDDDAAEGVGGGGGARASEGDGLVGIDDGAAPPEPEGPAVIPVVETAPVKGFGDAADDVAIWVHPTEPEKSLVLGTDKTVSGGVFSYELDGSVREFLPLGEVNNIDLRAGFQLGGREVTLVTATNRTTDTLVILALDHGTRNLADVAASDITTLDSSYGLCMYKSPDDEFFVFVNSEDGAYAQLALEADGETVTASVVREFCVETQPEGCVADDEHERLFVGEEGFGVWVFPAEADSPATGATAPACETAIPGEMFASTLDGDLARDVEGMAIAKTGTGEGFLVVSAQGNHEFVMFDRIPPHERLGSFTVFGGGEACIDGVEETDGLDITTAPLGPEFPEGLFAVQDGFNGDPLDKQNFKFVRAEHITDGVFEQNLDCNVGDYGGQARFADLPPGPERTEAFCAEFCQKCAGCYEEGGEFSEGDCHYKIGKPNFVHEDCLTGCSEGSNPADTRPLLSGWQDWACMDLDDAL